MYQTTKTFIHAGSDLSALIDENPSLLLMLEHFGLNPFVQDLSIGELCRQHSLPEELFICIANLYNGFVQVNPVSHSASGLLLITRFLNNSHRYYKEGKYPEIRTLIRNLMEMNRLPETTLVERFFTDYFDEVLEHLDYEDRVVFPYIRSLTLDGASGKPGGFSVEEYQNHHSDIASKLEDLKNLLLKHIPVQNEGPVRRRLLLSLYELETDLHIHTRIEDHILIPMVKNLETHISG